MDNRWIKSFQEVLSTDKDRLVNFLPEGKWIDRVSELVWWIRNKVSNMIWLMFFSISNIRNDRRLVKNWQVHATDWRSYMKRTVKNSWLAFEYFLVDFLRRKSIKPFEYKWIKYKFIHIKWSPEQDSQDKIDFLTRMRFFKNKKQVKINFWIQLTTEKSRASYAKKSINWLDWIGTKKDDIRRTSQRLDRIKALRHPESIVPDIMCLLSVNSHVNNYLNIQKINIFKTAFSTWQQEKYPTWWPTQYLNNDVKNDFEMINDWYKMWLIMFYSILKKILEKDESFKWFKEKDNFFVGIEYQKESQEIKMDFFLKNETFLMSLYFIVNKKIVNKVK